MAEIYEAMRSPLFWLALALAAPVIGVLMIVAGPYALAVLAALPASVLTSLLCVVLLRRRY